MLRQPRAKGLFERVLHRSGYGFTVPDRDENGFRALGELQERGLNRVANALAQSLDHVLGFVVMLRTEIGFYVGCLNLHERLALKGEPTCLPETTLGGELALSATGLYDVCLSLTIEPRVVGNDVDATGRSLVMITGANQGGKSTFLRSLGVAQLMAQSGMFAGAQSLRLDVVDGLFTHFKREEDRAMEGGKLDEELARMSDIADHIAPNCMLLCNESFASTNEREGSEIARQVICAMRAAGIRVLFVTHMFDLANGFYEQALGTALFLRAHRGTDGDRPFKLSDSGHFRRATARTLIAGSSGARSTPRSLPSRRPHSYRPVEARGGDGPSVGTEGDAKDRAGTAVERRERLVGGQTPEPDRPILAAGGDNPLVGGEHDTVDGTAITDVQRPHHVVALHVPQADRSVVAVSGSERLTVGTVRNAVHEVMGLQRSCERGAALYAPQHNGASDVGGREAASSGTEREACDGTCVIVEPSQQAVRVHVPKLDRPIGARSRERAPIRTERDAVDRAGVGR